MTSSSVLPLIDRPRWRGRVHLLAFCTAVPTGLALIVAVDGGARTAAAAVYVVSLLLGLGVSSAYHRIDWSPRMRDVMQRLDHAAIYLLIAGTYVPLCVVALPPAWGVPLLVVVGIGYMSLLGRRLLPQAIHPSLTQEYHVREYLSEIAILEGYAHVDPLTPKNNEALPVMVDWINRQLVRKLLLQHEVAAREDDRAVLEEQLEQTFRHQRLIP